MQAHRDRYSGIQIRICIIKTCVYIIYTRRPFWYSAGASGIYTFWSLHCGCVFFFCVFCADMPPGVCVLYVHVDYIHPHQHIRIQINAQFAAAATSLRLRYATCGATAVTAAAAAVQLRTTRHATDNESDRVCDRGTQVKLLLPLRSLSRLHVCLGCGGNDADSRTVACSTTQPPSLSKSPVRL